VKKLALLIGAGLGIALMPFLAFLALLGVTSTAIACTPTFGGPLMPDAPVPSYARTWVQIAQQGCPEIPETFFAAVMLQESGFRPTAYADDKNGGTWGLFQVNASIWSNAYGAPWEADLNGNGVWDVKDPEIHAAVGGKYLCARLQGVRAIRRAHPDWASTTELSELDGLVIAHNAGEGRLRNYPAIPAITERFIENVRARMTAWAQPAPMSEPTGPPAHAAASDCPGEGPAGM
jgi:hypothetical protein